MGYYDFEREFFSYLEGLRSTLLAKPLVLGGIAASSGGSGGPPGGFIGYLPQGRVAYDTTEIATMNTPTSGYSLVDNLNHIRYRLATLEASGVGGAGGGITVQKDDSTVGASVTILNFEGSLSVVENTLGKVTVTVTGAGDVTGPASSTDHGIARFSGTGGKTLQNSTATVDDSGGINIPTGQTYNINGSPHSHATPKLDDLSAPDDNTDLNTSTSAHGLMPKLPNDSTKFLNGTGNWVTVSGSGAGSSSFHGVKLYKSADTIVPTDESYNIAFNTEIYDTDAYHGSEFEDQVVIPAGLAGYYLLECAVWYFSNELSGTYRIGIYVNGSEKVFIRRNISTIDYFCENLSTVAHLDEADIVNVTFLQDTGEDATILAYSDYTPHFTVSLLGQ